MKMVRRQFCCDASRQMYEDYYTRQAGGQIPVFVGARHQRGHGLGSILGSLFRGVVPFIKRNIGTIGKSLAKTGLAIAGDVLGGRNVKEAVKHRVLPENMDPRLKKIGSNLLETGMDIAGDVVAGKRFKEAVKRRAPEGIKRTVRDAFRQKGSGRRTRRNIKRRRRDDIFDGFRPRSVL